MGIKDVLAALKKEMCENRRAGQPGEGETYWEIRLASLNRKRLLEQKQEIHWWHTQLAQIKIIRPRQDLGLHTRPDSTSNEEPLKLNAPSYCNHDIDSTWDE